MRINKFLAEHTELSRRKADEAIEKGFVTIDGRQAKIGNEVDVRSVVCLNGVEIKRKVDKKRVVLLDKPVGYVCSKDGQGSPTVYDLLSEADKDLNIAGRLDKDSSGLVILTDDGKLLNELTHPSFNKKKEYEVTLNKEISAKHFNLLTSLGVDIGDDRVSTFDELSRISPRKYKVVLSEGRNRQIRRTFASLNYDVQSLRRIRLGSFTLNDIA